MSASFPQACCRKRARVDIPREPLLFTKNPPTAPRSHSQSVICRGVHFETTQATLSKLGPCYLSTLADIDTSEGIQLDFSVDAFKILLDALTVAQLDLGRALLHVARNRTSIVDLDALLEFVLLDWVLGVAIAMPPPPASGTPLGDKFGEFRDGFNLRSAYQGQSGVFHYLIRNQIEIPCSYVGYEAPPFLLSPMEEYIQQPSGLRLGCIPVSIETDTSLLKTNARFEDDFEEWKLTNKRISSICMLQVTLEVNSRREPVLGDIITLHAGSAAVFDLGPRRELLCEGLVLGMNRTSAHIPGGHLDILTIDAVSDLDKSDISSRLVCQPLNFETDLITYFRIEFPKDMQRLGRMFRLRVDPFHPKVVDYCMDESLSRPLYMLRSVEFFGTLLDIPPLLCPDELLRPPFTMDKQITRIQSRIQKRWIA